MTTKTLHFEHSNLCVDFTLKYRVTAVSGDSGTGKSYLVNLLNSIRHIDPTCPIACANSIDTIPSVLLSNPELVILDKIEQYATPDQLFDLFCQASDSTCFLVFARSNISLPVTLYSYARLNWELSDTKRVTLQYLLERDANGFHIY